MDCQHHRSAVLATVQIGSRHRIYAFCSDSDMVGIHAIAPLIVLGSGSVKRG